MSELFVVIVGHLSHTDANGDTYARAHGPMTWDEAHEVARAKTRGEVSGRLDISIVPVEPVEHAGMPPKLDDVLATNARLVADLASAANIARGSIDDDPDEGDEAQQALVEIVQVASRGVVATPSAHDGTVVAVKS